jgi:hypothetical protein
MSSVREVAQQAERVARAELQLAASRAQDALEKIPQRVAGILFALLFGSIGVVFAALALFFTLAARMEMWVSALLTAAASVSTALVIAGVLRHRRDHRDNIRLLEPGIHE